MWAQMFFQLKGDVSFCHKPSKRQKKAPRLRCVVFEMVVGKGLPCGFAYAKSSRTSLRAVEPDDSTPCHFVPPLLSVVISLNPLKTKKHPGWGALFSNGGGRWTHWTHFDNRLIFCILQLLNNLQIKNILHIVGNLWELFLLPMLQNSTALSTFQAIKNNRQPLSVQLYLSCRSPSDAYKLWTWAK